MTRPVCIITGSSGSIGSSLAEKFSERGLIVLGIDCNPPSHHYCDHTFLYDLNDVVNNKESRAVFRSEILEYTSISRLALVINCAAYQPLVEFDLLDVERFQHALSVNTVFPLLLYRIFSGLLTQNSGSLINIGSIHASLTKNKFALYASSKSALRSLTHSLAIENKGKVLTYLIEPAAINSPLLREGFVNSSSKLDSLAKCHPCQHLGSPSDLSEIAWFLYEKRISFLHGTTIDLSGGIKHVLHDPDSL